MRRRKHLTVTVDDESRQRLLELAEKEAEGNVSRMVRTLIRHAANADAAGYRPGRATDAQGVLEQPAESPAHSKARE